MIFVATLFVVVFITGVTKVLGGDPGKQEEGEEEPEWEDDNIDEAFRVDIDYEADDDDE